MVGFRVQGLGVYGVRLRDYSGGLLACSASKFELETLNTLALETSMPYRVFRLIFRSRLPDVFVGFPQIFDGFGLRLRDSKLQIKGP